MVFASLTTGGGAHNRGRLPYGCIHSYTVQLLPSTGGSTWNTSVVLITPFGARSALTEKKLPPAEEPRTGGSTWNTSVVLITRFMSKSGGQASWPLMSGQALAGSVPMMISLPLVTLSPSWSIVELFGAGELEAAEMRREFVPS